MANDTPHRRYPDKDADAALEEILREVERSPKRRSFLDDDDEDNTPAPRRRAASSPENRRSAAEDVPRRTRTSSEDDLSDSERRAAQSAANREAREQQNARRTMQNHPVLEGAARKPAPRQQQRELSPERPARPAQPQRSAQQQRRSTAEGAPQSRQAARRPANASAQRADNAQSRNRSSAQRPNGQRRGSRAAVKRRASRWRIGLLIYIIIFFLVIMFLMHRLWGYLGEYEASRPQYTIDGYVTHLNSGFYSSMIRQKVDQIPVSNYETADTIASTLVVDAPEEAEYTWSKNSTDYSDDNPSYYVRCNNAPIATVTLQKVGTTEKFGFPIWRAMEPESLIEVASEPAYDLEITIPSGASVMVNGQAVPLAEMTDCDSHIQLDETALNYAEQPMAQRVQISGLYVAPEVKAFDNLGNQLEARTVPDASETHQVYVFEPKDEVTPDADLENRMDELTKAYINYMINKDLATWDNLNYLENYLIIGSSAQQKLRSMVSDVGWNNPYTERVDKVLEISHYKMYSDDVYTCESHFELQLTNNVVNDYIGTVRWTMIKTAGGWKAAAFEMLSSGDNTEQIQEDAPEDTAEPAAENGEAAEPADAAAEPTT